jgi:hypothetical protein
VNPFRRAFLEASNIPYVYARRSIQTSSNVPPRALNAETASEGNNGSATEPWPSEPEEEENHEDNSAGGQSAFSLSF